MSRGLGRVERGVLDALRAELTTRELARSIYRADEPTEAQLVSVRRAVANLRRRGLVTTQGEPGEAHRVRLTGEGETREPLSDKFVWKAGDLTAQRPDGTFGPLEEVVAECGDDNEEGDR